MSVQERGQGVGGSAPPAVGRACSTQANTDTVTVQWVVHLALQTVNFRVQMAFCCSVAAPAPHNGRDTDGATEGMECETEALVRLTSQGAPFCFGQEGTSHPFAFGAV